jgi:hypothetical protein
VPEAKNAIAHPLVAGTDFFTDSFGWSCLFYQANIILALSLI